ncbi:MAG: tetratricopeptide repeat protein [Bryobacterales bacterium]|nr:tetratricopeptide repeat protein [Bryobacteraceae bacterium]MDW8354270.1 tetratricopeptide repeat protein [Bryobacterales bacterium]
MIALREPLILAAAAAAVYGAGLAAPFHLDDYALLSDRAVTASDGWRQVWAPLRTRPLTYFTFWLNYRLAGSSPASYHAVNLGLHALASALTWSALRRLIPGQAALFAALLFAVHPIQSEAVNYVFARSTLLMSVFCLAGLRDWVRGRHWRTAAWFLAALLAKEECAAFPAFLLLLFVSISRSAAELRPIAAMAVFAVAAGVRVVLATAVEPGAEAGVHAAVSPAQYFASQGVVIWRYLRLLVLPWGFTVDPDVRIPPPAIAAAAWMLLAASAAVAWRRFDRAREGFWWIAGLVLLLPSSSVFPASDLSADRRMYLPMVAFSALAGLAARRVRARYAVGAVALLAVLGAARTQVWRSERALWEEASRRAPRKLRPKLQLARLLPPPEALRVLEEARRLAPEDPRVPSAMGRAYLMLGDAGGALREFGRALALAPQDARAYNNRGVALMALGQLEAARRDFQTALTLDPCLFDAHFNLVRQGRRPPPSDRCPFSEEQRRQLQAAP